MKIRESIQTNSFDWRVGGPEEVGPPRGEETTADPFILSGTVCLSHGNCEGAEAVVIGVGSGSQWGKIKADSLSRPRHSVTGKTQ